LTFRIRPTSNGETASKIVVWATRRMTASSIGYTASNSRAMSATKI
jgi:hypothetical protein